MPVVGDGDDDEQVERGSEHRDEEQQHVNQQRLRGRRCRPPARAVEELWEAEFSFFHHQAGEAAELGQFSNQNSVL